MGYDLMMNLSSGDLSIEDGQVRMVDGAERIAQQILISLRFWLGEWFLEPEWEAHTADIDGGDPLC